MTLWGAKTHPYLGSSYSGWSFWRPSSEASSALQLEHPDSVVAQKLSSSVLIKA